MNANLRKSLKLSLIVMLTFLLFGCPIEIERGKVTVTVEDRWLEGDKVCFFIKVKGVEQGKFERVTVSIASAGQVSVFKHFKAKNGNYKICVPLTTVDVTPRTQYSCWIYISDEDPVKPFPYPTNPKEKKKREQWKKKINDKDWVKEEVFKHKKKEFRKKPKKELPSDIKDAEEDIN